MKDAINLNSSTIYIKERKNYIILKKGITCYKKNSISQRNNFK